MSDYALSLAALAGLVGVVMAFLRAGLVALHAGAVGAAAAAGRLF
ncbi:MAG: hypothetical protein AAB368_13625 [bacterium]